MNEQQQLIKAIFNSNDSLNIDQKGLAVYKRNLKASAIRALEISFPTVGKLIGEELFSYCAEQLLLSSPPQSGDWGLWGEELASLLTRLPALESYPYVADIAKLDYALHILSREKDSAVDFNSMSLLASHDIDSLIIIFNPSIKSLISQYPIFDIYQANNRPAQENVHEPLEENLEISALKHLNNAKLKMAEGIGQQVLLYRPQFKVLVREQSIEEQYWSDLLRRGISIGKVLEEMENKFQSESNPFLLEEWLPVAIQENIISHIEYRKAH